MIEFRQVTIRSGPFTLAGLELHVPTGTTTVLMGRTGAGKTTILEALCGLRPITHGRILLGGVDISTLRPGERGLGYVPQDLALFPTLTVREHLEFSLRVRKIAPAVRRAKVDALAAALGLAGLMDRDVTHLSGGEGQRVALGRALAFDPPVLVLDEPLNALDDATRFSLCELLRTLQRARGLTVLYVTHNHAEADRLADDVVRLESGRLSREGPTE